MMAASFSQSSTSSSASNTYKVFVLRHGQTDANAGGVIQGSSDFSRLTTLGKQQAAEAALQAFNQIDNDGTALQQQQQQQMIITSLYCSPLRRAQETLQVLRQSSNNEKSRNSISRLPPTEITLENLREIDFYDWEGHDKTELESQFPVSWKAWEEGDPEGLMVLDTSPSLSSQQADYDDVDGSNNHQREEEKEKRYPLFELWNRADQVWDEIMEHERTVEVAGDHQRASLIVAHGSLGQALLGTAMGWGASRFRDHEFPNCGMAEIEWNVDDWSSQKNSKDRRPLATRWRWRWPVPSVDWNTVVGRTEEEESQEVCQ